MSVEAEAERSEPHAVAMARLAVASAQAVLLYGLVASGTRQPGWPALPAPVFVPLLANAVLLPVLALVGMGRLPVRPFAAWLGAAAAAIAALGLHDATRGAFDPPLRPGTLWPSPQLWLALVATLFVANVLVTDAVLERRLAPSYARHFDTSWKGAVQLALAVAFVGVFWGVLGLGAGLFKLIGIAGFRTVIAQRWFAIPATTLAFAAAVHVTDVNPGLIRGIRSLVLTLLSWLLPLIAGIALAFLASLPVTGLEALWRTRFAATLLLVTAGLLVAFINTAYRVDAAERPVARVKLWAMRIGSVELVPVVALAAWALGLRVAQYGWTVDRILAAAATLLGATYAVGYAVAALSRPGALRPLEATNIVAAYLFLVVAIALASPVADPSRLMVADQLARLRSRLVAPEALDVAALRFEGARWGRDALLALSASPDEPDALRSRAKAALDADSRFALGSPSAAGPAMTPAFIAAHIDILPAGRTLPEPFLRADFLRTTLGLVPSCLRNDGPHCTVRFLPLRDGRPEALLLLDGPSLTILETGPDGTWTRTARVDGLPYCAGARSAFETGEVALTPHPWQDVVVKGQPYPVTPSTTPCPG